MERHHANGDLEAEHRPESIRRRLAAERQHSYLGDAVLGGVAFFAVGSIKGYWLGISGLRDGLETLAVGGVAALLAFGVGAWLRTAFGIA